MFGKVSDLVRGVATPAKRKKQAASPTAKSGFTFEVIDNSMQEKLKMGVKYNMKVLVKGERGSGKSCLLKRLQGKPFVEEYEKTPQIEAATIHWQAKEGDEAVKVEVWDVVDQGFRTDAMKAASEKLQGQAGLLDQIPISDAENIDVYREAHCIVIVIDSTNPDGLQYLKTELQKIPKTLCVLALLNKCDLPNQVITEEQVNEVLAFHKAASTQFLLKVSNQKVDPSYAVKPQCISASLANCYGLRQLYSYLNVPFGFLKTIAIEGQLRKMWEDISSLQTTISDEASESYEDYISWLDATRPEAQVVQPPGSEESPEAGSIGTPSGSVDRQQSPVVEKKEKKGFKSRLMGSGRKKDKEKEKKEIPSPKEELKVEAKPTPVQALDYSREEKPGDTLDDFFDDVSGDEEGAEEKDPNAVGSDVDSEDLTAGQLAWRTAHGKQGKTKPEPEPESESETEEDRAARRADEKQAKKDAKKRATDEKKREETAKREKEALERKEWKERDEREKKEKEEQEMKKQQLFEEAAVELGGGAVDDAFFSDVDEEEAPSQEPPAAEATDSLQQLHHQSGGEQEEEEQDNEPLTMPPIDLFSKPTPEPEEAPPAAPAVSADAMEALAAAMSTMQAEVNDLPEKKPEKKEKKPKKEKKEGGEREKRRRRREDGEEGKDKDKERRRRRRETDE